MSRSRIEQTSVETLYRDQGGQLWRAVFSFCGDRTIADESVAEAFAQLIHRGGAVRDPAAWVWRAAFRIAAGELKERGRRDHLAVEATYEMPDPLPEIFRSLARLPRMQRAVIVMYDFADRPTAEIAETLGIARSTVRVHLSQARRTLKKMLEDQP